MAECLNHEFIGDLRNENDKTLHFDHSMFVLVEEEPMNCDY